jgi:hypothetical protein
MRESTALIRFPGDTMPKPYSMDLRERVIDAVKAGASRRETAEQFGLSPSVVIIWGAAILGNRKPCANAHRWQRIAAGRA